MDDMIELLDVHLLDEKELLREIDHLLALFNWINGWHYDLDIIWIVKQLEKNNILPGATILDAGAGYGITQFLLASHGYNVISLDFTRRDFPPKAEGIFDIEVIDNDLGSYKSEYMDYMTYGKSTSNAMRFMNSVPGALLNPVKIVRYMNKIKMQVISYATYRREKAQSHSGFGKIQFLRGTFNNIPLDDETVDALISISAFEHNVYGDMPDSINEFNRVLKNEGVMLVTTSAARDRDWYQEASKGWNFTRKTLSEWFNISSDKIFFDYDDKCSHIQNSKILSDRLSDYYTNEKNLTVPEGNLRNIEYIPVGIRKNKYYELDK